MVEQQDKMGTSKLTKEQMTLVSQRNKEVRNVDSGKFMPKDKF